MKRTYHCKREKKFKKPVMKISNPQKLIWRQISLNWRLQLSPQLTVVLLNLCFAFGGIIG
jgi:hypothetical protein